jgi:hypothetical protein
LAKLYERTETVKGQYREWLDYIDGLAGQIDGEIVTRIVVESDGAQAGSDVRVIGRDYVSTA